MSVATFSPKSGSLTRNKPDTESQIRDSHPSFCNFGSFIAVGSISWRRIETNTNSWSKHILNGDTFYNFSLVCVSLSLLSHQAAQQRLIFDTKNFLIGRFSVFRCHLVPEEQGPLAPAATSPWLQGQEKIVFRTHTFAVNKSASINSS